MTKLECLLPGYAHSGVFFAVLLRAALCTTQREMTKSLPVLRRSYLSLPPMSHLAFPLPKRIREKNILYFQRESERRIGYMYFQRESEKRIGYTSKENQRRE
jgi:hypothetical protein